MKIGVFLKSLVFFLFVVAQMQAQEHILKGAESPNDTLWTKPEGTSFLHFTPDGKYLVTSGANNTTHFRNVLTGEVEHTLEGIGYIDDFSPDNKTIAVTLGNQSIELRNYHDNSFIRIIQDSVPFPGSGRCRLTFNGQRLVHKAGYGSDNGMYCFNTQTGKLLWKKKLVYGAMGFDASRDGRFVATVGLQELTKNPPIALVIYDGETGEIIKKLQARSDNQLVFSPDGNYLALYDFTDNIKVYSTNTWQIVNTFRGNKPGIYSVAFTPKAGYIVAQTSDINNPVWNIATGEKTYVYPTQFCGDKLVISPDSALIGNYGYLTINMLKAYWNPTDVKEEVPTHTELSITPNPSSSSSVISFSLPTNQNVKVEIFNIQGNLLKILHSGILEATEHKFVWMTSNLAQGVYFVKLTTPIKTYTQQVQVIKK